MNDEISKLISERVQKYKEETEDYLDMVKWLVFTYLIEKKESKLFNTAFNKITEEYILKINRTSKTSSSLIKDKVIKLDITSNQPKIDFTIDRLNKLLFKIDYKGQKSSLDKYTKIIKNFYHNTEKVVKKEYVGIDKYLSSKVNTFDKVEKVVAYYNKDGTIRAYYDIASYNSMIENTNLTSRSWNGVIETCQSKGYDLVYVVPHAFSCPLCQEYQGKTFSLTGLSYMYPSIDIALEGGLKHPNCKHEIVPYQGQYENNKYSSEKWVERYEAKEKKQALELKKKRLNTDKEIFKKLNNYEEVDKITQKIKKINEQIKVQANLMK